MKIIPILVEEGIIDEVKAKALEMEVKREEKTEEELLLERKIISEEFLFKLKSKKLKVPSQKIALEKISEEIFDFFPEKTMVQYKMAPLTKTKNTFEVGMVYPEDIKSQETLIFLSRKNKFKYKVFLITFTDFNGILKKYRTLKRETERALKELKKEEVVPKAEEPKAEELVEVEKMAEEAPVIKIVSTVLQHAVEEGVSDIHIEPTEDKLKFRFRIEGFLYSKLSLPRNLHSAVIARIKILSDLRIDETRLPQDGRFSKKILGRNIDFRVSTFPTILGEKVAIRILDPEKGLKDYKELGLTERNFQIVQDTLSKPHGLILSVGPTGCGKSTTLYAFLRTLNKEGVNIVTVEDPIEYFIKGINQSQVKSVIGYTFANALRQIMRQDPDIIMVGEIRDSETASLAIHAGLTGHIVLSTLHTNDAVGAIPRLIDMGIKSFLIPPALNLIVAQRLIRTLCPHCKKKIEPSSKVKEFILEKINSLPEIFKKKIKIPTPLNVWEPQGCPKCNSDGYLGRTGIFEVLKMTNSLAQVIIEEPTEAKIFKEAQNQGMITMEQDGVLKALSGETSIEEVIRVAEER